MNDPPRKGNSGKDCPQCGQGMSKTTLRSTNKQRVSQLMRMPNLQESDARWLRPGQARLTLSQRLAEAKKDGERYSWLKDSSGNWWQHDGFTAMMMGQLDEVVDAAIAQEKEEK